MAIYSYRCGNCGKELEVSYPIGEYPPTIECSVCGNEMGRIIVGVGVIVPYDFKSVKPFVPEVMDAEREVEEVAKRHNFDPNEVLPDKIEEQKRLAFVEENEAKERNG